MTNETRIKANEIAAKIFSSQDHLETVRKVRKSCADRNQRTRLNITWPGSGSTESLQHEFLPIDTDNFLDLYETTIEKKIKELQGELDAL